MRNALTRSLHGVRLPIVLAGVVVAAFLLAPIGVIVATSLTAGQLLEFPPQGLSTRWYASVLDDPTWTQPFWTSVKVAAGATVLATTAGTAAALAMRRMLRRGGWLRVAFVAPIALPYIAYALGLYDLFTTLDVLVDTNIPVAIGQAVIAFPIVYVIVAAGLAGVDQRITAAAATLGARWPTIVWRIELPLVRRSILAAALFGFAGSFEELMVALFLAPPDEMTFQVRVYRAVGESISPQLAAASTLVVIAAAAVLLTATLAGRRARNAA